MGSSPHRRADRVIERLKRLKVGAGGSVGVAGGGGFEAFAGEPQKDLPTVEIDANRMPTIARNIQSALDKGHPSVLNRTTDQDLISSNRAAATSGFGRPEVLTSIPSRRPTRAMRVPALKNSLWRSSASKAVSYHASMLRMHR